MRHVRGWLLMLMVARASSPLAAPTLEAGDFELTLRQVNVTRVGEPLLIEATLRNRGPTGVSLAPPEPWQPTLFLMGEDGARREYRNACARPRMAGEHLRAGASWWFTTWVHYDGETGRLLLDRPGTFVVEGEFLLEGRGASSAYARGHAIVEVLPALAVDADVVDRAQEDAELLRSLSAGLPCDSRRVEMPRIDEWISHVEANPESAFTPWVMAARGRLARSVAADRRSSPNRLFREDPIREAAAWFLCLACEYPNFVLAPDALGKAADLQRELGDPEESARIGEMLRGRDDARLSRRLRLDDPASPLP